MMHQNVNLPPDAAWTAMTADLWRTKQERKDVAKENA